MKRKKVLFTFAIVWFIYPVLLTFGGCALWSESREDGWYILYEMSDIQAENGAMVSWEEIVDGPISQSEAKLIIDECVRESNLFFDKYGTIYKPFLPMNTGLSLLGFCIIWLGPYFPLYRWWDKISGKSSGHM